MQQVSISKLADIKTVFNSIADNEHYYQILKNSNNHIIDNVEFARPTVKRSNSTILWKSESNFDFTQFNDLSEDKQNKVAIQLSKFFNIFNDKIGNLRNVNKTFANQLIQIPNLNSIYINEENDYIVITNWGFLEDSFNRKENLLPNIFKKKSISSILIKLVNNKQNPISNKLLKLDSTELRETDRTDNEGYARMGAISKGEQFSIYLIENNDDEFLASFECDGRSEYIISIDQKVDIKLEFKNEDGNSIQIANYTLKTKQLGSTVINTNNLGEFQFTLDIESENFEIINEEGKVVFNHEIPDDDTTFKIKVEQGNEIVEVEEEVVPIALNQNPKHEDKLTFKFINNFNKPIKNLSVGFIDSDDNNYNFITDQNGEIILPYLPNTNFQYSFTRYNKNWKQNINTGDSQYHIIKVRSIFPWLWWLIMSILLGFLICCFFFNCCCSENNVAKTKTVEGLTQHEKQNIEQEGYIICNSTIESGGQGVTEIKNYLGQQSGTVEIYYDTQNIPDKIEIFYENKMVTSTSTVSDNINGFVGDSNSAGCCGTLQFNYEYNKEVFCVVRVTGPDETVWAYEIKCPK